MAEHLTSNCLKLKGMIAGVVLRSDSRQKTIGEGLKFEYKAMNGSRERAGEKERGRERD
jgi:hypothetical protein